jgi:dienelactone hydrolase
LEIAMIAYRPSRFFALVLLAAVSVMERSLAADDATAAKPTTKTEAKAPSMRLMQTPGGTQFGLFGEKPASPAPTLFIFATAIDDMGSEGARIYTTTGREVAQAGWLYVVIDPPCHGYDHKEGEPSGLNGWAYRIKAGQDLMGPFVKRCSEVLDFLIAERYSNPDRVAASGTSRGGFCALHFAAAEPRIRAVTTISPVTNPLALTEFAGVTREQVQRIHFDSIVDLLAGRPVWLSMGNYDGRVDTDECVTLGRKLVAASRRLKPELKIVPVELVVGPSQGHSAIDNAYSLAAQFLLKQISNATP